MSVGEADGDAAGPLDHDVPVRVIMNSDAAAAHAPSGAAFTYYGL